MRIVSIRFVTFWRKDILGQSLLFRASRTVAALKNTLVFFQKNLIQKNEFVHSNWTFFKELTFIVYCYSNTNNVKSMSGICVHVKLRTVKNKK